MPKRISAADATLIRVVVATMAGSGSRGKVATPDDLRRAGGELEHRLQGLVTERVAA